MLIIKHLPFLPQLPQMNCPKMGSLIFNCNFSPKNKDFCSEDAIFSCKHRNISFYFPNFAVFYKLKI